MAGTEATPPRRAPSRRVTWMMAAGAGIGIGLAVWLVAANDVDAVTAAFARVGWGGLAAVVGVRIVIVALCGLGWARLLRGLTDVPVGIFLVLRWVREAINVLLPVASVGGDVLGGRLVTFWGVTGGLAAAGILVDMLIQAATQAVFALVGVALLSRLTAPEAASLAAWSGRAVVISAVLLAAFFAVQRLGFARRIEAGLVALMRRWPGQGAGPSTATKAGVQDALDAVWRRPRRVAEGTLLHLAAWFAGVFEILIALRAMGYDAGFAEAAIIESLSQALRSAAFPVPSGLGVQEGSFVVLGALFGIDPGAALALSLVKRVPDIVLGLPGIAAWQWIEARRAAGRPLGSGRS